MYNYIKALHIIFIVTWFSGLFYIVRLFIYNTEANDKPEQEKSILHAHFSVMIKRLWLGITFPSAVLTLIFGLSVLYYGGWLESFAQQKWLHWKLLFVVGLYAYHFSLHAIYKQQMKGVFKYTSNQLRVWNEVATLFLVAIVFLVVVKDTLSFAWGLLGLFVLMIVMMTAIRVYKKIREK
jgi:putative membrane protein